jgi:uncharacterized sodium:solute symporter family permease YidK
LSQIILETDAKKLKTLVGILLGLASIVAGWILFSSEGFYSPTLFLSGMLMMPIGVLMVGIVLTGLIEEHPS